VIRKLSEQRRLREHHMHDPRDEADCIMDIMRRFEDVVRSSRDSSQAVLNAIINFAFAFIINEYPKHERRKIIELVAESLLGLADRSKHVERNH